MDGDKYIYCWAAMQFWKYAHENNLKVPVEQGYFLMSVYLAGYAQGMFDD